MLTLRGTLGLLLRGPGGIYVLRGPGGIYVYSFFFLCAVVMIIYLVFKCADGHLLHMHRYPSLWHG